MIILYINCSVFPFVNWIISGLKTYETRNRNTLKNLLYKTVYIAETGKGKRPVIRCKATITDYIMVDNVTDYNKFRKYTRVEKGSVYDFTSETKRKYLYKLDNVQQVNPFPVPDNVVKHGRVYAELTQANTMAG